MLEVKPLQSKIEQETACLKCDIEYAADYLAYAAYKDGHFVCLCQFKTTAEGGIIKDIKALEGRRDAETLDLTLRAALSFMDLCGNNRCECRGGALDIDALRLVGFEPNESGHYAISFDKLGCQHKKTAGNPT